MKQLLLTIVFSFPFFQSCNAQGKHLEVGDSVPFFELQDQDGHPFSIKDHIGKKILVIYFYPKDESGVCTKEACAFRDSFTDFTNAGAMVIGINSGSVASHHSFIANHQLPFTLLSDPDKKVLKMFGVKKKVIITGRETFVIDLQGRIAFEYNAFTEGKEHAEQALQFIKKMQSR